MVPQGHRVESILEPDESIFGTRTSIHEILDSEEAVAARVERELGKPAFERPETAVDVTDHEVSTEVVDASDASTRGSGHSVNRRKDVRKRRLPSPP